MPRLSPSQTGQYLIYLPQRDGRLSWPWCLLYTEMALRDTVDKCNIWLHPWIYTTLDTMLSEGQCCQCDCGINEKYDCMHCRRWDNKSVQVADFQWTAAQIFYFVTECTSETLQILSKFVNLLKFTVFQPLWCLQSITAVSVIVRQKRHGWWV